MHHSAAFPIVMLLLASPRAQGAEAGACPPGMRWIEAGRFRLGDGSTTLSLHPFCLDETEVTAARYTECVRAGHCADADLHCSNAATYGDPERADQPINCVSWLEANAYCRRAGKRLPTEGEWEWAARGGGRATAYPWGAEPVGTRACWDGKGSDLGKGGRREPCAVGAHPDGNSPDGVADLAGNVREWTSSQEGRFRVVRGGSWGDSLPEFLTASFRGMNAPDERFELTGFRCAVEPRARTAPPVARAVGPSPRPTERPVHQSPAEVRVMLTDELVFVVPSRP